MNCVRLILLAVVLGAAARGAQYFSRRSFWHDEAFLIRNLRQYSAMRLLGPLNAVPHQPQAAPPVFLWAEKAALSSAGTNELALRLSGFVLSLLSLVIMARLAWIALPPWGAVAAVTLFALSDHLILHSAEVKPYSWDAFFACLVLWTWAEATRSGVSVAKAIAVGLLTAGAIWCSYTTVFVIGSIAMATWLADRRWKTCGLAIAFALPAVLSLAVLQYVCMRYQRDPKFFIAWHRMLADWSKPWQLPAWMAKEVCQIVGYIAGNALVPVILAIAFALVSTRRVFARREIFIALLFVPVMSLLAALAEVYPTGGSRASLYAAPAVCLLAGAGIGVLVADSKGWRRITGWAVAAVGLTVLVGEAGYYALLPRTRSHIRPAIEYVRGRRAGGEALWVFGETTSEDYLCYEPHPDSKTNTFIPLETPLPPGRTWLIFAGPPGQVPSEARSTLQVCATQSRVLASHEYRGGAAYLVECETTSSPITISPNDPHSRNPGSRTAAAHR